MKKLRNVLPIVLHFSQNKNTDLKSLVIIELMIVALCVITISAILSVLIGIHPPFAIFPGLVLSMLLLQIYRPHFTD